MNNNRFTRLKICGIRSIEEIEELKDLPVNYFGCIFVSKSPRFVSNELAKKITEIAHSAEKKTVGVFLDEKVENIINIIKKTDIDIVQLHGNETPEYCKELYLKLEEYEKEYNKKIKIWKAFSVKNSLPETKEYSKYIEFPLFDAKGVNAGGNGIVFDWNILSSMEEYSFILAGGLEKENIAEALSYNPAILDVNSKVEVDNRKNRKLIEEVISEIRNKNLQ